MVLVFTLFDALVANKYLDQFSLNYRINSPKAVNFQETLDHLPDPPAPLLPDLILLNDLENIPSTFMQFLAHHWDRIDTIYPISHKGSLLHQQTRKIGMIKKVMEHKLYTPPLPQHSSCGTLVEQIVKMAAGYETRDIELYTTSFHSIIAEFPPI